MREDNCVILDCRFNLADPGAGFNAWCEGHIANAQYCDLDKDLSSAVTANSGRHPIPDPKTLESLFSRLGVDAGVQVFTYDDSAGAIAARAWWLLRYLGHDAVAVINGGAQAWRQAGYPWDAEQAEVRARTFTAKVRHELLVGLEHIEALQCLCDAREPERYRGEREPIDPVAGHIPGARNFWFGNNLDSDGQFLPVSQLRMHYQQLLDGVNPQDAVFYCGSGVTACHNLLAMAYAGLGDGRLYAGSWSQWCSDPARPIAKHVEV